MEHRFQAAFVVDEAEGIPVFLSTMTGESTLEASHPKLSWELPRRRSCEVCTALMFTLPGTDGNSILVVIMQLGAPGFCLGLFGSAGRVKLLL